MNDWNGTAWWGFCHHCACWFNNHKTSCPSLPLVPSTAANPIVWPVTPMSNAAAANPVQMFQFTSGGAT